MDIRVAGLGDVNKIVTLCFCVWLDTYADQGVTDEMADYVLAEFNVAGIRAKIERHNIYVAVQNLAILGIIVLDTDCHDKIEIKNLYVLPKCQNKSIGRLLVSKAADLNPNLWLSCWLKNTAAIGFYLSIGFIASGESVFELAGVEYTQVILSL